MDKKRCSRCRKRKHKIHFYSNKNHLDGLQSHCIACSLGYGKSWIENHKERAREIRQKAAAKFRRKNRLYCNGYTRRLRFLLKEKILNHYGKKCNCCGEKTRQFLTIDHVKNDGFKHRKIGLSGYKLYNFIIKMNFPKTFQILCMNCNFGKRQNKGVCPHIKIMQRQVID